MRGADEAYLVKLGSRPPKGPAGPVPIEELHAAALAGLRARVMGLPVPNASRAVTLWTPRWYVRYATWHWLDHAWEIEDRAVEADPLDPGTPGVAGHSRQAASRKRWRGPSGRPAIELRRSSAPRTSCGRFEPTQGLPRRGGDESALQLLDAMAQRAGDRPRQRVRARAQGPPPTLVGLAHPDLRVVDVACLLPGEPIVRLDRHGDELDGRDLRGHGRCAPWLLSYADFGLLSSRWLLERRRLLASDDLAASRPVAREVTHPEPLFEVRASPVEVYASAG